MALIRLEVGIGPEELRIERYPVLLAVGARTIELACFGSFLTGRHYIRMVYKKMSEKEPLFLAEPGRLVAPWFEL